MGRCRCVGAVRQHTGHRQVQIGYELQDALLAVVGDDSEQSLMISRQLQLLANAEGAPMGCRGRRADDDLDRLEISKDHAGLGSEAGGSRVTFGLDDYEAGAAVRPRDGPTRQAGNGQHGFEAFFQDHVGRCSAGGAVNRGVALPTPAIHPSVEFLEVGKRLDIQEGADTPDDSLHSTILLGPARGAGVDGEAVVPGEVDELGIEYQLRPTAPHHGLEVIVVVVMRGPEVLPKRLQVTGKEELNGHAEEETDEQVFWSATAFYLPGCLGQRGFSIFFMLDLDGKSRKRQRATQAPPVMRCRVLNSMTTNQSAWAAPFEPARLMVD